MMTSGTKASSFLKIGVVLFCFMCLFFATYMASRYEHQKTKTEIQVSKARELEEKIRELTTANKELLDIRAALATVYKNVFPLKSKDDIVGLNEVQCGNPGLYSIAATNDAMAQYMRCLYTREQAEEAGIGSIYNPAW